MKDTKPVCPQSNLPTRIEHSELVLRSYSESDNQALLQAISDSKPFLSLWQDWVQKINSIDDAALLVQKAQSDWLNRTRFAWVIEHKNVFVGHIKLDDIDWHVPSFSIGYWLRETALHRGFATSATRILCSLAFDTLGAQRVQIECDSTNEKSAAVAKRLGFTQEGTIRNARRDGTGKLQHKLVFSMIPEDFLASNNRTTINL